MKVRVKFTKTGPVKFIGHLDVMRYFQKALRRADFSMKLTEGFSPHPVMSFAAPLALGDTSECEYMDVELLSVTHSDRMRDELNAVMAEGIEVLSVRLLPDGAKNAMSSTAVIDSRVRFRQGMEPFGRIPGYPDSEAFFSGINDFLLNDEVMIVKAGKKGKVRKNVKPFIRSWISETDAFFLSADVRETFVNPKHILQAYASSLELDLDPLSLTSHRVELYTEIDGSMITLEDVGQVF
ncbi:MAG: TIGR03936 family radical SAM-associated protein [Lachnospiraceae bacterium]|nr:TIGR03936 family radical SAM-associated protein [Lachnospiraceae bacterium]